MISEEISIPKKGLKFTVLLSEKIHKNHIFVLFSAFNTSDWGNRDELSGEYLGPSKTILNDSALNGIEVCYFKGFRDDNGDGEYPLNINFFQVWIARLAFILIFQVFISSLK